MHPPIPSLSSALSRSLVALLLTITTSRVLLTSASPLASPQVPDGRITNVTVGIDTPSGPPATAPNGATCSPASFFNQVCNFGRGTVDFKCVNTLLDSRPMTDLDICDKNGDIDAANPVDTLVTTSNGSCAKRFFNLDCDFTNKMIVSVCGNTRLESRPMTEADKCDKQDNLIEPDGVDLGARRAVRGRAR